MDWADLYQSHAAMREVRAQVESLEHGVRQRLQRLADLHICSLDSPARFTYRTCGPRRELYLGGPDGRVALDGLEDLKPAHLTVLALTDRARRHLHQFTAMLEGKAQGRRHLVVAVHLQEDLAEREGDRKGTGACAHAAFHCHVGPTLDAVPRIRVPLPPVGPVAAFDWLLTIAVPGWEPAPWPDLRPEV
jgi:hypothetical protein